MLEKLKKIFVTSVLAGVLFLGTVNVNAAERKVISTNKPVKIISVKENEETSTLLKKIGTMSIKEHLVVENISVPLYVTFDSQKQALQEISGNMVIQAIKDTYGYEDISNDNWHQYYDSMYELLDSSFCPVWYDEEDINFRKLRNFFDIYENEEKNNEIISLASVATTTEEITENANVLELLPYESYNMLSQQSDILNNKQSLHTSRTLGFNISDGISYATKYATSPNTSDYKKFSSDCTNFTSQILENGGVAQEKYDDETKGWWHTKSKTAFITTHKHSISWIRADTFAKYMGVGYTTTSHSSFSKNIAKGDFIVADFESDGDWNHMGFVTNKKSSQSNGYYDYKVAQHTSNYHAWASSSTNGWDTIAADGGKYGRVRR